MEIRSCQFKRYITYYIQRIFSARVIYTLLKLSFPRYLRRFNFINDHKKVYVKSLVDKTFNLVQFFKTSIVHLPRRPLFTAQEEIIVFKQAAGLCLETIHTNSLPLRLHCFKINLKASLQNKQHKKLGKATASSLLIAR